VAAPFDVSRIPAADEAGKGADRRKTLIASSDGTAAILLEMREELQHQPGAEIAYGQAIDRLAQLAADEGQQQAEDVAITRAGVPGQIAFGNDVFDQEAPEPWANAA
jgi:hypothetical protein